MGAEASGPDFRVTLRPLARDVPVAVRLRRLLKYAGRRCGLQNLGVQELHADRRVAEASLEAENACLRAEVDRLRADLLYLAERCWAQSEKLTRRAERGEVS